MSATGVRLRVFGLVLCAVLVAATIGFSLLEEVSVAEALYFSVVTVATVGYGDITPATAGGKLLAVVLIVTGVGTFLGVVANATDLLLERRQEKIRKERLSMVISLFFSEIGTQLLRLLAASDPASGDLQGTLGQSDRWSPKEFTAVRNGLDRFSWEIHAGPPEFDELRTFLGKKSGLLLRMLENQNLLEHESFTELLRAVFHLKEELLSRPEFGGLPESDLKHLAGDAKRVYPLLTRQWLSHLQYLSQNYPYLHSLAVRTNPFNEARPPIVGAA